MEYSLKDVFKYIKENKIEKNEALKMIEKLQKTNSDFKANLKFTKESNSNNALFFSPQWEELEVNDGSPLSYDKHFVLLIEGSSKYKSYFKNLYPTIECTVLETSNTTALEKRFEQYCIIVLELLQNIFKKKIQEKILIQIIVQDESDQKLFNGLIGLLRTSKLENPAVNTQLIVTDLTQSIDNFVQCGHLTEQTYIKLNGSKKFISGWKELENTSNPSIPWQEEGVYLITGGLGGLGLLFAKEIANKIKNVRLILCGRSPLRQNKQDSYNEIKKAGVEVEYYQINISNKTEVDKMFYKIKKSYGKLSGIIHSAGVIKDNYIFRKKVDDFKDVLAPKVAGLVNLDEGSRHFLLDFFVLFSSGSGCTGNQGQCDYATANTFMDMYAVHRNELVNDHVCNGHTLSINWPLWKEGGMNVNEEVVKYLREVRGMKPMSTSVGFDAFYKALDSKESQVMVIEGHKPTIRRFLLIKEPTPSRTIEESPTTNSTDDLYHLTLLKMKELLVEVTKHDITKIDAYQPIATYGIESFMVSRLNQKLSLRFKELSKTIFYEYTTLFSLVTYLIENFNEECQQWVGRECTVNFNKSSEITLGNHYDKSSFSKKDIHLRKNSNSREPIAIIGISGRYPQAETLEDFWKNLESGKDCITQIPKDRWSIEDFYDSDQITAFNQGKSYSKWGGFINDATQFDPLFFSISPREAANMDPQERIFLESCWEVLEDAGYSRKRISKNHNNRVGVFAGVTKIGYSLYKKQFSESHFNPLTSFSSIANRVSYVMNFNGPSMPIDTMCSSSLTALHEACEHLYQNTCEMAIAGGVNLYLHPSNYIDLCNFKMLSSDGKCRSFGRGGNGFVPGEGVGCVLLKPLSSAIKDKDNIYALIKATNINHGGKTSGYTVPNPKAQASLVQGALNKAGINARSISYLEAHGTGTELGDPIEIKGLTQAYAQDTNDVNFCSIGSAKSNIGHLEAAAGIAGITKIILQIKYKKLVPTLHTKELNPNINFNKTPFVVQKEVTEWKRPTRRIQDKNIEFPRRAGISSFGAGGANAHVIIEEYQKEDTNEISADTLSTSFIIPISAKNKESLRKYAHKLLKHILNNNTYQPKNAKKNEFYLIEKEITNLLANIYQVNPEDLNLNDSFEEYGLENFHKIVLKEAIEKSYDLHISMNEFLEFHSIKSIVHYLSQCNIINSTTVAQETMHLSDMAYTLQIGREAMEERAVFIVDTLQELVEKLENFSKGQESEYNVYSNLVTKSKEEIHRITSDTNWSPMLKKCYLDKKLDQLANFWIQGIELNWEMLYTKETPNIISLPTYAFLKKKYWIPNTDTEITKLSNNQMIENKLVESSIQENTKQKSINNLQKETEKLEKPSPLTTKEIEAIIKELISKNLEESLDLEAHEIHYDRSFADYGLDSILGVGLIDSLNAVLKIDLETIKLFDYSSVNALTTYILSTYKDDISQLLNENEQQNGVPNNTDDNNIGDKETLAHSFDNSSSRNTNKIQKESIAIIGMSGRYANSENLDQLWNHLVEGKDLVNEVSRWDLDSIHNSNNNTRERYCNSGSFVDDIDKFDPLFFNISGVEAIYMDPQQRIFLEESWKALEDAGYAGDTIKGMNCGVYVGCCGGDYQEHFSENTPAQALWGTMGSVIPSRIAYYLDFKGPAISVDTSCSSSLVSINLACKDLWSRETNMALAGGVFIQTTPRLYSFAEGAGMLSPDGRCKSFDQSANGFVPGEGAGVIVLKRLSDAIEDGDHIYGVIKGIGINQDGTTNGITAPSANSQKRLLTQIYEEFDVDPENIQMVEAHGTGTKLGDPIEFSALQETFRRFTDKKNYSALGSIKTNLGHSQFAAGIAGVLKILLSLKYEMIPPSLHFKEGNKAINFEKSPFFVNKSLLPWTKAIYKNRTAVASSFGASGTNAHIVLTEAPRVKRSHKQKPVYIIPLSARVEKQLVQQVENLITYCQSNNKADLGNIAYTLGTGRKHMNYRLAVVVSNISELINTLQRWKRVEISEFIYDFKLLHKGSDYKDTDVDQLYQEFSSIIDPNEYIDVCKNIAKNYVEGKDILFKKLFTASYSKVSLPTYPFAKERYWVEEKEDKLRQNNPLHLKNNAIIHPLVHRDNSHNQNQSYLSVFTGDEFFLKDHHVRGKKVLPGVAYLEIARTAAELLAQDSLVENNIIILEDVVWISPIEVEQPTEVRVTLKNNEKGNFDFNIESSVVNTNIWSLNSQGRVVFGEKPMPKVLDIDAWQKICSETIILPKQCYEAIKKMKIVHGPSLKSVVSISVGNNCVLSKLILPPLAGELSEFVLHPSMLDAAIQASMGLFLNGKEKAALPFGIESTTILRKCTATMWVLINFNSGHTTEGKIQKLDIDLYDENANICVQMKGYASRVLEEVPTVITKNEQAALVDSIQPEGEIVSVLLHPVYDSTIPEKTDKITTVTKNLLILGGTSKQQLEIKNLFPNASVLEYTKEDSIATLQKKLENHNNIDHFIWITEESSNPSQGYECFVDRQERGVFLVFKLIKALLQLGYDAHNLEHTVITTQCQAINNEDVIDPTHAGIHGLIGSMAKEYPHWKVRLVDMPLNEEWSISEILELPYNQRGHALLKRNGTWFHQRLLPIIDETPITLSYKQNGTYIIIGGAGGIGKVWTEYLIKTYKANVIWIGRKAKDFTIQAQLDVFNSLEGPNPEYISADATDQDAFGRAYQLIKQKYGTINGLIHSALVLKDQGLARMNEDDFRISIEAKVNTSVCLAQTVDQNEIDFVLFFSSIQSFAKVQGQSNYAAGCIFKDAFAHYLRQQWSCDVKVMNWGYWGSVGVGATKAYQQRMANFGLASIEMPEAMIALERLLNSTASQLALSKGSRDMQIENIYLKEHLQAYPKEFNTCVNSTNLEAEVIASKTQNIKNKIGSQLTEMDAYLVDLLWGQLHATGIFKEKRITIAEMKMQLGKDKEYHRWLDESLRVLERHNYLTLDHGYCTLLKNNEVALDTMWHTWEIVKASWMKDPNRNAKVALVETTMRALPSILLAKKSATDVIFPRSSMKLVEGVYKNNAISDYFNDVLSDVLINYVEERIAQNANVKIRILEIGAGTGGTSALLFDRLKPYQSSIAEYCYTDLSKAFLNHAKREYGAQNPYLSYKILDIEKPVVNQDILPGIFDIVIATNVLHATKNIKNTLRNTKVAMKTNGILLLNEINSNSLFNHLTFGLLKGWWLYDDTTVRIPGSPGLSPQSWKQILENEGYRSVLFPAVKANNLGQAIIVAESNGIVRIQQPYLFDRSEKTLYNNITSTLEHNLKKKIIKKTKNVQSQIEVVSPKNIEQSQRKQEEVSTTKLKKLTIAYVKDIIAETLKISAQQIHAKEPLESYGIDSILVVQVTNALRKTFTNVKSTLLFEFQTINDLSDHFIKTQKDVLLKVLQLENEEQPPVVVEGVFTENEKEENSISNTSILQTSSTRNTIMTPSVKTESSAQYNNDQQKEDIAIIGLSGSYPQAQNVNEFWDNLKAGKNCISEVPTDRWDWKLHYDPEMGKDGKIYAKWGGFIDEIDKFDPLFFKISPAEAEKMDPQERLFLQTAYASVQDAGYTPKNLSKSKNVGVFVGAMNANYPIGAAYFSIANRVSYSLNFQGPSLAVDTACSSSLTAIHLAMQSLYSKNCECAIAGGVNLIVDSYHYQKLCDLTMLSANDQCKSFGINADGFVDGEGVGAIVLKPLSKAEADGDHIYGVLKGSAINSGGKTNGYMVPNPVAQAELIKGAYEKAKIDLRKVSYIEAHGTGTSLGDPIEVLGLTRAFENFTSEKGFCALGSVKSNIGHAESAAGIAGLTKVLMQMKYKQLVPSLHCDVPNPNIDFKETPFILQKELKEWKRPEIVHNNQVAIHSRIAGISSFGAGGANAHLIVEEYNSEISTSHKNTQTKDVMIILSAKNEDRLFENIKKIKTAIDSGEWSNYDLNDIAYTLQVGRESMELRLALIVDSLEQLLQKLEAIIANNYDLDKIYHGKVERNNETIDLIFDENDNVNEIIVDWITKGKYSKVLSLWVKGLEIDWSKLPLNRDRKRVSLPTYSFAKEHYWMERSEIPEGLVPNQLQFKYKYDELFYEELFDGITNDTLSMELAIEKLENFYNN